MSTIASTIAQCAAIARRTLEEEEEMAVEMSKVCAVCAVIENEKDMDEIEFGELLFNQVPVIDEETGKEVYFDPFWMYFCEVSENTLYVTNTVSDKH